MTARLSCPVLKHRRERLKILHQPCAIPTTKRAAWGLKPAVPPKKNAPMFAVAAWCRRPASATAVESVWMSRACPRPRPEKTDALRPRCASPVPMEARACARPDVHERVNAGVARVRSMRAVGNIACLRVIHSTAHARRRFRVGVGSNRLAAALAVLPTKVGHFRRAPPTTMRVAPRAWSACRADWCRAVRSISAVPRCATSTAGLAAARCPRVASRCLRLQRPGWITSACAWCRLRRKLRSSLSPPLLRRRLFQWTKVRPTLCLRPTLWSNRRCCRSMWWRG